MKRVTGIGGIFFRARDTGALAAWYEQHLGISELWKQEQGLTVFAPFKQDREYRRILRRFANGSVRFRE